MCPSTNGIQAIDIGEEPEFIIGILENDCKSLFRLRDAEVLGEQTCELLPTHMNSLPIELELQLWEQNRKVDQSLTNQILMSIGDFIQSKSLKVWLKIYIHARLSRTWFEFASFDFREVVLADNLLTEFPVIRNSLEYLTKYVASGGSDSIGRRSTPILIE